MIYLPILFLFGQLLLTPRSFSQNTQAMKGGFMPPISERMAAQLYVFGEDAQQQGDRLDSVLIQVKRAGFPYVQGWTDVFDSEEKAQQFEASLHKQGLAMPCAYGGGTMHTAEGYLETSKRLLNQARIGVRHGLKVLVHNPDPIQREKTDEELEIQSKNLNELGKQLKDLGVQLAVHQHDPEMRSAAREWYHILRKTSPDAVYFCLDLHWIFRGKQDPYQLLQDAGSRVIDLHLRNSHDGNWSEEFGEGDIDYRRVQKILKSIGYQGYYTIELAYEPRTKITRSLEENLKRSFEYALEVFAPSE
jgi:inosose dehydratase